LIGILALLSAALNTVVLSSRPLLMIRLSDGKASARQCHVSLKQSRHLSTNVAPKEYHDLGLLSNLVILELQSYFFSI
jgi:hypothetical protein